jgi:hypothetical protein
MKKSIETSLPVTMVNQPPHSIKETGSEINELRDQVVQQQLEQIKLLNFFSVSAYTIMLSLCLVGGVLLFTHQADDNSLLITLDCSAAAYCGKVASSSRKEAKERLDQLIDQLVEASD